MPNRIRAVIFDHTTLVLPDPTSPLQQEVCGLVERLRSHGLAFVVFSTHPTKLAAALTERGLPGPDLYLTSNDIPGKMRKGSPAWIAEAANRLEIPPYGFLYIGDDRLDWRTAISSATFFLHAGWSKPIDVDETAIVVESPKDAYSMISHFLLLPPRWAFQLDEPEPGLILRSLLPASVELACDPPRETFTLQDVFTYGREITVGSEPARDALMMHALSSLYLEGLIPPGARFAAYPSHEPGKHGGPVEAFLGPASTIFRGYYREDLLDRQVAAADTSLRRAMARREGRSADVSIGEQVRSLCVNPKYKGLLDGKTVIVMDDFTSTGMSLEWARNLLQAAGAGCVILMTIGKYGLGHDVYSLSGGTSIDPFSLNDAATVEAALGKRWVRIPEDSRAVSLVKQLFHDLQAQRPFSSI